jgi:hypothetical protein
MPATDLSLLWPGDPPPRPPDTRFDAGDLDLETLAQAISPEPRYTRFVRGLLADLSDDPAVIRCRQEVLDDLLRVPALADTLAEVLDLLTVMGRYMNTPQWQENPLRQVAWRLSELENYVDVVNSLNAMFAAAGDGVRAAALLRLRDFTAAAAADPAFADLSAALPDLLAQVRQVASVTIGVNLDDRLRPVEAVLLAFSTTRFRGSTAFRRLFGRQPEPAANAGLGPLHRALDAAKLADSDNPLLNPLFKDLSDILEQTSRPVAQALRRYVGISARALVRLESELAFYLGAARLVQRVRAAGLPMCRPEIAPADERACALDAAYNIALALRFLARGQGDLSGEMVTNDVRFGVEGRIFILTGPNRGGKTTYTQAVGLAHVLFQAGLYVPAAAARISPVDGIYTHFAAAERPDLEAGRLGEESRRLGEIFARATRRSLILLNESLASTSAGESLYLARDIVRAMRLLGVRAIYATHLHELAADAEAINAETPGDSAVVSLVSVVTEADSGGEVRRTYRIVPGPPMGRSYAREIAARYGISFEQLTAALRARRAIP